METMINKDKKISFNNRALVFLKNNSKIIISVILSFLLIFILYQYYFLQKKQKPLELSKIYDQVNANFDSVDFEEKMNIIEVPVIFSPRSTGEISVLLQKWKLLKVAVKCWWQTISFRMKIIIK